MTRYCWLLLLLFSCAGKRPKDILPPEKMKQVTFDLIRADEFLNNFVSRDSGVDMKYKTIEMYEQVFAIHQVSRQQFYKSYKYYQQHADEQKQLFDSIYTLGTRANDTHPNSKLVPK